MIRLCFVGDYCPSGDTGAGGESPRLVCVRCQGAIDETDLAIANLERCLVPEGCQCDRPMALPESQCGVVAESGFDVFTLANNHVLDCGAESVLFAKRFLQQAGIRSVGAGANRREADAPLVLSRDDRNIAIFSVTDATHYRARRGAAGVSPLRSGRLKRSVRRASDHADLVIVCIHSDLEFSNYPAPWKVRLSRRLVKAGADIVVHHHPHTLQGIEKYDGALIVYSLGNFVFPVHGRKYMTGKDGHVDESIMLTVDIQYSSACTKEVAYRVVPIVIRADNTTSVADGSDGSRITGRLANYSRRLQEPEYLRQHYFGLCREQARRFLRGTYYALRRGGFAAAWRFVRVHVSTDMHRNWMRGLLTLGRY